MRIIKFNMHNQCNFPIAIILSTLTILFIILGCGSVKPTAQLSNCNGDTDRCLSDAQNLLEETNPNYEKAARIFSEVCNKSTPEGCIHLGKLHAEKKLKNSSIEIAKKSFQRACEMNQSRGCAYVGEMVYAESKGENLKEAIFWFERACRIGHAYSCNNLALFAEKGHPISDDLGTIEELRAEAQDLLKAECDKGTGASCQESGQIYAYGMGVPQDLQTATHFFKRGCQSKQGAACVSLGMCYSNGQGVSKDNNEAEKLYHTACKLGAGDGCAYIGAGFRDKGEIEKAIEWLQKACELKSGIGCDQLAVAYGTGSGVPNDQAKAFSHYQLACKYQFSGGCNTIGRMYQLGLGVKQNYPKALEQYLKVCDGPPMCEHSECKTSTAESCNNVGAMYGQGLGVKADTKKAVNYLKKGCKLDNPLACTNVTKFESHSSRSNTTETPNDPASTYQLSAALKEKLLDIKVGKSIFSKERTPPEYENPMINCEFERADGCLLHGIQLEKEMNYQKALKNYSLACKYGSAIGCYNIGIFHELGRKTPVDYEAAFAHHQKACEMGDPRGCGEIAYMFTKGLGCAQDRNAAIRLYTLACDHNDLQSCKNLGIIHLQDANYMESHKLLNKSCVNGYAKACQSIAALEASNCLKLPATCDTSFLTNTPTSTQKVYEHMEKFRKKCSKDGIASSCVYFGLFISTEENGTRAEQAHNYFELACNKKNQWGCYHLANWTLSMRLLSCLGRNIFRLRLSQYV